MDQRKEPERNFPLAIPVGKQPGPLQPESLEGLAEHISTSAASQLSVGPTTLRHPDRNISTAAASHFLRRLATSSGPKLGLRVGARGGRRATFHDLVPSRLASGHATLRPQRQHSSTSSSETRAATLQRSSGDGSPCCDRLDFSERHRVEQVFCRVRSGRLQIGQRRPNRELV